MVDVVVECVSLQAVDVARRSTGPVSYCVEYGLKGNGIELTVVTLSTTWAKIGDRFEVSISPAGAAPNE